MSSNDDSMTVRSTVFWRYVACRGYHAYHNVTWFAEDQYLGQQVIVDKETNPASIAEDPRCCVIRTKISGSVYCRYITIGHIPREISRYVWWFIHHGGMVDGVVVDLNKRRSPIPSGGTEIKLKLYFRHTSMNVIDRLEGLVSRYKYDLADAECIEEAPSSDEQDGIGDDAAN